MATLVVVDMQLRQSRDQRSLGLIVLALVWAAFLFVIGSPVALLFTVPLFMLAAPLALGRYVGENLVTRLLKTFSIVKDKAARSIGNHRPSTFSPVRGGQILASALAGRGPPVLTV